MSSISTADVGPWGESFSDPLPSGAGLAINCGAHLSAEQPQALVSHDGISLAKQLPEKLST